MKNTNSLLGDFALFGFSKKPQDQLRREISQRLGIEPRLIDFGTAGVFYFYTTYGDVIETEELIGLKLGFARTPELTPLSTQEILAQKLITPRQVVQDGLRGNALVACFNKKEPEFSVYQNIFATPQLYYMSLDGDILCSSSQRCLIYLADRVELNQEVLPFHFLFQLTPGPLTYFRDVTRLFPGQHLRWRAGQGLTVDQVKTLRFEADTPQVNQVDSGGVERVYERINQVISTYLDDAAQAGYGAANLLSGGVDSSVIQLVLKDWLPSSTRPQSFSYDVHLPGFEFEVEYARQASQLLGTDHTIADIQPQDFPDILIRAIETVAQPVSGEADACKVAMAEFLAAQDSSPRFFFAGQAADAVFGMRIMRKFAVLNLLRKVPAGAQILQALAELAKISSPRAAVGFRDVARNLGALDKPTSYYHWPNEVCTYIELDKADRLFGQPALQYALAYRRNLEKQYLGSSHLAEQLHVIDLITEGYEPAIFSSQMFLAHRKEQIYPYLDEDIMRAAFSFNPRVRFVKPGLGFVNQDNIKYLLKQILIRRSFGAIAQKKKGASAFGRDLFGMMRTGPLRDMVAAIDRPAFLNQAEFETLLGQPDYFLWNMLTFDIFQKRVLNRKRETAAIHS